MIICPISDARLILINRDESLISVVVFLNFAHTHTDGHCLHLSLGYWYANENINVCVLNWQRDCYNSYN